MLAYRIIFITIFCYYRTYAVIAYLLTPSPSATLLPLPEGGGWGEGAKRANFGEMRKSCITLFLERAHGLSWHLASDFGIRFLHCL